MKSLVNFITLCFQAIIVYKHPSVKAHELKSNLIILTCFKESLSVTHTSVFTREEYWSFLCIIMFLNQH